jgi:penicillin V acylase-like amidase (Ntn superfamily)
MSQVISSHASGVSAGLNGHALRISSTLAASQEKHPSSRCHVRQKHLIRLHLAVAFAALAAIPDTTPACTRVVYLGADHDVITARSMDWRVDVGTNLYILPRGASRNGAAGPNSITWTAKYGSVVATGYDVSTTDGMNEKGLAAELLWLVESQYPTFGKSSKPGLTIAAWAQYVLDNFASVGEAVAALQKEPFTIVTDSVPGEQRLATLHLSMSDATGDSAIVEYIGGRQVIHHGRQFQVMTNSPIFDEQLALNEYWKQIGGTVFLPGTNRSSDRFARAAFYINAIPKSEDPEKALASVFSVIRNVSVPFGINTPSEPNISSTRWRTVADHKRMLYFFESALTPNTFWVDLKKIDFAAGAAVRKLDLGKDQHNTFDGEVSGKFQASAPFQFLGLSASRR